MPLRTKCKLWSDTEGTLKVPMQQQFALIETLFKTSHHWRYVLECRECATRYLMEFYEEIDWKDGEDPSWTTYVPISSDEDLEGMRKTDGPSALRQFRPCLTIDHPKGAPHRQISWLGKTN